MHYRLSKNIRKRGDVLLNDVSLLPPLYNDDLITAAAEFMVQAIEVFYKLSNIRIRKSPELDNIPK
jgi:hypothetical protein